MIDPVRRDGVDARRARFERDGFLSAVPILAAAEATAHRHRLERAEACFGPLHYRAKVYTILTSPLEPATHPRVLDTVERRIGFNAQYIATHMRQTRHERDTAMLVHGVDRFRRFGVDIPASRDLDPEAVARQRELERLVRETMSAVDP